MISNEDIKKTITDNRELTLLWYTPKHLFEKNYMREGITSDVHFNYEVKIIMKYWNDKVVVC